ncbi:acid protease [Bimuria novae-zelandiae CBS 107.79]|uniref:Acid protease n=1 Tax=Bimuria novae-zelandiae CBS 107.79 TaxID=1447943 RepID=A0A6A5UJB4_9PLEO|nr:acid protease [Bimuria novae-zelandiae CBS 107.79]
MAFHHVCLFLSSFLSIAVAQNDSLPKPFSFSNSQIWDGNDGKWSSFLVRVGTPEQTFRVLPASRHGETIIPIAEGCEKMRNAPSNCGDLRGSYVFQGTESDGFQVNETQSWHQIGIYEMGIRPEIGFDASALYGLDNVGLQVANSGGPTLGNMVVAGVAQPTVFVGQFGLSPKPSNFSGLNSPQKSFMQKLRDDNHIPSVSYGYTAGAYYKIPKVHGSLTLGGYDQSRFTPNNITFPFDADDDRPTSLTVQSITAQNTLERTVTLLLDATYVAIDSTVPHMWLPDDVCDRFEKSFGLTYDNKTDLYTINDTMHQQMLELNPTITISLGETSDPTACVNIVLPYGAFDVQASFPYYKEAVNYFPLRRGKNETQYTLGRVVFQEMYIVADYSQGQFSVHQALFPSTVEEPQIKAIYVPGEEPKPEPKPEPTTNTKKPTPSTSQTASAKAGISGRAIGGIIAGSIAGIGLIGFLAFFLLRRRRRNRQRSSKTNSEHNLKLERDMHSSQASSGMYTPKGFGNGFVHGRTLCATEADDAAQVFEVDSQHRRLHELSSQSTCIVHEIGGGERMKVRTDVMQAGRRI